MMKIQENLERDASMDKEKILAAARNEKSKGKEYENKQATRSSLLGSAIAVLVGISLFLLEYFIKDSVNVGLIAVGMSAVGAQSLFEGIKVKKPFLIVSGFIQSVIALLAIVLFIEQVVAL